MNPKNVSILFSLSPLFYLIGFVVLSRIFFGEVEPLHGPHQVALLLATTCALIQRIHRHHARLGFWLVWKRNFQSVIPAMGILFFVGMLIGAFACASVLESMISFGLSNLSPHYFLPGVVIVTAMSALVSGSSWTTAATLGVAIMGVCQIMNYPSAVCAGAIVSGCYFGDKLSPVSDTTNLASSLTGVNLFDHIGFMMRTTIPSFFVSLVLYTLCNSYLGFNVSQSDLNQSLLEIQSLRFDLVNFIPVLLVFGASILRIPAIGALSLGILSSALISFSREISIWEFIQILGFGFDSKTGDPKIDALLGGGGIVAILPTELLILSAVTFGAVLEGFGYLHEILHQLKKWIKRISDILIACMGSAILINLVTADQYLSLVIPARAFKQMANENGIPAKKVSRSLEDAGTISSPLIPWNSCGAFMATSLKVATISYLPFAWFNIIHLLFSFSLLLKNRNKEINR